jgi:hypothetical protein
MIFVDTQVVQRQAVQLMRHSEKLLRSKLYTMHMLDTYLPYISYLNGVKSEWMRKKRQCTTPDNMPTCIERTLQIFTRNEVSLMMYILNI